MTTLFCSLRGIVPACCVVAAVVSCSALADVLQGRCVSVADGDTATIVFENGNKESVRFWGIDAPESYQAFGQEGKKKLASLIKGKAVRVEFSSRDHHKRILGHVYCGEVYTNLEMVKAGLAWHYVQYAPNATEFRDAERTARKARLGCGNKQTRWSLGCSDTPAAPRLLMLRNRRARPKLLLTSFGSATPARRTISAASNF